MHIIIYFIFQLTFISSLIATFSDPDNDKSRPAVFDGLSIIVSEGDIRISSLEACWESAESKRFLLPDCELVLTVLARPLRRFLLAREHFSSSRVFGEGSDSRLCACFAWCSCFLCSCLSILSMAFMIACNFRSSRLSFLLSFLSGTATRPCHI